MSAFKHVTLGFANVSFNFFFTSQHTFGFDFAYDKTLYDRLKALDVYKVGCAMRFDRGTPRKAIRPPQDGLQALGRLRTAEKPLGRLKTA